MTSFLLIFLLGLFLPVLFINCLKRRLASLLETLLQLGSTCPSGQISCSPPTVSRTMDPCIDISGKKLPEQAAEKRLFAALALFFGSFGNNDDSTIHEISRNNERI